jgi:hypothetical protein
MLRCGRLALMFVVSRRAIFNDAGRCKCFLRPIIGFEHTSSPAHQSRMSRLPPFSPVTPTCPARFRFIHSVLPTNHFFGRHRPG